ncbi:hemolysin family protein [Cetobacterium somerae]|uniref:hemolysin family protein n=1 Tax=Cetobacterium sp. NK01 TaxID=2993530 RepID=UPI002116F8DC|nr:hemolysin family protein [Cetobacterium sp. NK01]MCQ8212496.1 hemolysin family protein [Cetobacterium sp. NK01]
MGIAEKLVFILFLILISAFFSMAEISLAGARKIKLQLLVDEGNENARKVVALQSNPGNFFTTVQIGLNIVAILAGIIGDGVLSPIITKYISNPTIAFLISFTFVTGCFVEFADLIPKRLAMVYPEKIALTLVNPMTFTIKILTPIVWIFSGVANLVFKIFNTPNSRDELITHDDIFALVDAGAEAGVVDTKEHHLIENVFELEQRWVSSAMTTRDEIIYFTLEETEESIKKKIAEYPHSKFLVCESDIDSIYGYVGSKDILPRILKGESSGLQNIKEITNRNILIIPNTLTLSEMLDRFNEAREDFAVILNEYAHVVGVITLNDVVSTLMGDVVYPMQEEYIIKRGDGSWLIDGVTAIEDVKKVIEIESFPEEDSYETIAGFMMYMLKSIPKKGAHIEFDGYSFEVVDVDNFKIDQLLVMKEDKKMLNSLENKEEE